MESSLRTSRESAEEEGREEEGEGERRSSKLFRPMPPPPPPTDDAITDVVELHPPPPLIESLPALAEAAAARVLSTRRPAASRTLGGERDDIVMSCFLFLAGQRKVIFRVFFSLSFLSQSLFLVFVSSTPFVSISFSLLLLHESKFSFHSLLTLSL